ncbi:hypothetical protein K1719_045743 [Acacia pycnantha]|nr:hypothetical protein K1719_045743 [Acacia pycnantha]
MRSARTTNPFSSIIGFPTPKLGDNPVRFRFEKMNVSSGWVAQVEAAQVEPEVKEGQLLQDSRLNKLELNNAEVEFKLNYMEMKLNDELQVKLNEHGMKIREQRRKMIESSMKMVAEFDRVEKEIRLLGRWARVFAVIVVVGAICIYVGGRLE